MTAKAVTDDFPYIFRIDNKIPNKSKCKTAEGYRNSYKNPTPIICNFLS